MAQYHSIYGFSSFCFIKSQSANEEGSRKILAHPDPFECLGHILLYVRGLALRLPPRRPLGEGTVLQLVEGEGSVPNVAVEVVEYVGVENDVGALQSSKYTAVCW